jgi:hypothetical protein
MKIAKLVVSLVTLAFCAAANAGLRCNGDIADIGDSKASVLRKCGAPFFAQTFCIPLRYVDLDFVPPSDAAAAVILGCFPVDEWSYNPGSGQFVTTMHFEAGRLTSIRYGDRIP